MSNRCNWIFLLTLFTATSGAAQDSWPEFRGPTGQGISNASHLPTHWSSSQNVTWVESVPGKGWSSPVHEKGRLYLTTAVPLDGGDDGDQSLRAICMDSRSGTTLWDVEIFHQDSETAPTIQRKNSHASPTPVIHKNRLYVHFGHQGTACLTGGGDIIWRNRDIEYEPVHGNGGSPIVVDDLLVFNCDGAQSPFVVALDLATGEERWRTERNAQTDRSFSFSTPLHIQVDGQPQIISVGSGIVGSYEPKTGSEIWRVQYGYGFSVVPRPVHGGGLLFICSGYMKPTLMAIRPDGEGDVSQTHVVWQTNRGVPNNPSLLLDGTTLFMVSDRGVASCLDALTGKVHWTERLDGNYTASPLLADGRIYLQGERATAHVIRSSTQFKLVATNTFDAHEDERTFASYAVGDGALFVRSEKHLFRIERR